MANINLPSRIGGFVVLESSLGPVIVITIAPIGAVITMDRMHIVTTTSA